MGQLSISIIAFSDESHFDQISLTKDYNIFDQYFIG